MMRCYEIREGSRARLSARKEIIAEEERQRQRYEAELARARAQQQQQQEAERTLLEEVRRREVEERRRQEAERQRQREEVWRRQVEEQASITTVESTTKRCPGCSWPIEKNKGCLHMTCKLNIIS